jgi:hypothetical protein
MKSIQSTSNRIIALLLRNIMLAIAVALILMSCSKDDEGPTLWGSYSVEEKNEYDDIDTYTITLSQSKQGGDNVEIKNFGGFMYVPIKATLTDKTLTIPSQSFTEGNMTIVLAGNGSFSGNTLNYNYTMKLGDDIYEYSCIAKR